MGASRTHAVTLSDEAYDQTFSAKYDMYWPLGSRIKGELFGGEEDFIVEELYDGKPVHVFNGHVKTRYIKPVLKGFVHFDLVKRGLSTFDCAKQISERFGIPERDVQYCGLKDNFAVTAQKISIPAAELGLAVRNSYKFDDFVIRNGNLSRTPLDIKLHNGNRFLVNIRINSINNEITNLLQSRVRCLVKKGVPNFYGPQRFGPRKNSHLVGLKLLHRDYAGAAKLWLTDEIGAWKEGTFMRDHWGEWSLCRRMLSENSSLRIEYRFVKCLEQGASFKDAFRSIPLGSFFVRSFSSFLFNKALSRLLDHKERLGKGDELEMLGFDTSLSSRARFIYKELLTSYGLQMDDFEFTGGPELTMEGTLRKALFFPKNVRFTRIGKKSVLSFSLGRGNYATVFLSMLFDYRIRSGLESFS